MSSICSRSATYFEATAPPAGPDIAKWIGWSAAALASINPPLDFIIAQLRSSPASSRPPCRLDTYRCINGLMYASAIVVLARSYSRQIGATSWEIDSGVSGKRRRSSAASCSLRPASVARRSCCRAADGRTRARARRAARLRAPGDPCRLPSCSAWRGGCPRSSDPAASSGWSLAALTSRPRRGRSRSLPRRPIARRRRPRRARPRSRCA